MELHFYLRRKWEIKCYPTVSPTFIAVWRKLDYNESKHCYTDILNVFSFHLLHFLCINNLKERNIPQIYNFGITKKIKKKADVTLEMDGTER